ncbi:MAG: sigma-70 family RNA polymerase sigma factor [Planctomycetaceae bacterium]|nr:sigma-70 family RNA polymerase sigma factor [Planctomycetaceae bacterium]
MADETDDVLQRLRGGDDAVLGELFSRYQPMLRKMVRLRLDPRLTRRVDDSDIVQDIYINAARRLSHFREHPEMPFAVWMRLIAGQTLLDLHRQHLAAQRRDVTHEMSIHGQRYPAVSSFCLASQLVGDLTSPSQAARRDETRAAVQAALEQLEPIDREILALRHFEELGNREVAELLGLQKAAASNRYVRALQRLKGLLKDD